MTTTLRLKTSELREGDVVLNHGMRILLDKPRKEWHNEAFGPVYAFRGLVTNYDEVVAADPSLAPLIRISNIDNAQRGEPADERRWTIQGNDNATWGVERVTETCG